MMNTVTFTPYLSKSPYGLSAMPPFTKRVAMGQGPQQVSLKPGLLDQVRELWTGNRPWIPQATTPRFGLDLII